MSNELKIGLTVILAMFAVYIGMRFMSDVPLFRQPLEVTSTFDRVDGLGTGNIVYMNGLKIGSVKSMELTPDYRVRVVMAIENDVNIPDDSVARLTSSGLLDGKSIVIQRGTSDSGIPRGDEIEGIYMETVMEDLGARGEEISSDLSATFSELNHFLMQLNHTLDDESRSSIGQAINNIETTTSAVSRMLVSRQNEIEEAISSANRMMAHLDTLAAGNRPRVDSLMENLEVSTRDLKKISGDLDLAIGQLNEILLKINEGEGTVGRLVNDPSLYQHADSLTIELHSLIRGLNENPGRYLRHMNLFEIF